MPERTVEIRNPSGLHARPAATFVKTAAQFGANVQVANLSRDPEKLFSAKSVLGVLGAGVSRGHRVRLVAEGDDAEAALDTLEGLIVSGIGEPIGEQVE
jgi:phosphotransferase system HPr (HPr) family protein